MTDLKIEIRGSVPVLIMSKGFRPATPAEVELMADVDRLRRERDEARRFGEHADKAYQQHKDLLHSAQTSVKIARDEAARLRAERDRYRPIVEAAAMLRDVAKAVDDGAIFEDLGLAVREFDAARAALEVTDEGR